MMMKNSGLNKMKKDWQRCQSFFVRLDNRIND